MHFRDIKSSLNKQEIEDKLQSVVEASPAPLQNIITEFRRIRGGECPDVLVRSLTRASTKEKTEQVLHAVAFYLNDPQSTEFWNAVNNKLKDPDLEIRDVAVKVLKENPSRPVIAALLQGILECTTWNTMAGFKEVLVDFAFNHETPEEVGDCSVSFMGRIFRSRFAESLRLGPGASRMNESDFSELRGVAYDELPIQIAAREALGDYYGRTLQGVIEDRQVGSVIVLLQDLLKWIPSPNTLLVSEVLKSELYNARNLENDFVDELCRDVRNS